MATLIGLVSLEKQSVTSPEHDVYSYLEPLLFLHKVNDQMLCWCKALPTERFLTNVFQDHKRGCNTASIHFQCVNISSQSVCKSSSVFSGHRKPP